MDNLETGIRTVFCSEVLQRFNTISLIIQDPQLVVNRVIYLLDICIGFTTWQQQSIEESTCDIVSTFQRPPQ